MYRVDLTQPQLRLLLDALSTHEEWLRHAEELSEESEALIKETGHILRHAPECELSEEALIKAEAKLVEQLAREDASLLTITDNDLRTCLAAVRLAKRRAT